MSPEEIRERIIQNKRATRADIQSLLQYYGGDESTTYTHVQIFLDDITELTNDEKLAILGDLDSYVI
jgi:hypothetical protein